MAQIVTSLNGGDNRSYLAPRPLLRLSRPEFAAARAACSRSVGKDFRLSFGDVWNLSKVPSCLGNQALEACPFGSIPFNDPVRQQPPSAVALARWPTSPRYQLKVRSSKPRLPGAIRANPMARPIRRNGIKHPHPQAESTLINQIWVCSASESRKNCSFGASEPRTRVESERLRLLLRRPECPPPFVSGFLIRGTRSPFAALPRQCPNLGFFGA